jgi:glycosyltransferase involved in cell wall biosynthesis
MKILFSPSHYLFENKDLGSEITATYNIVDRIASKYPESVVVTGKENLVSKPIYRVYSVYKNLKFTYMNSKMAILFHLKVALETYKILRRESFDIIHHVRPFLFGKTFNLVLILGLNKKTPFVIGSFCMGYDDKNDGHKDSVIDYLFSFLSKFLKKLSVLTLQKADRIIVYDISTKEQISEFVDERKIEIIPPGKDKYLYSVKTEFNPAEKFTLLHVGNLIPRKGCDLLLRAFAEIVDKVPHAKLIFIGEGLEADNLKKITQDLGLENSVSFLGKIKHLDISKYYLEADIFVSMQRQESFGQVYIEAMASGLPIVTTENNGSKNIIGSNSFGIVVSQEDIGMFAKQVVELAENSDILVGKSRLARKVFEDVYDWDTVIIPKYLRLYENILYERKRSK